MTASGRQSGGDPLETIRRLRVVPVVVIDDARAAAPLARALVAAGLPCAEVTLRTDAAEAALRAMAADPALCVGAGTVLRAQDVDRAVAAGARFVVSPGLSRAVVRRCRDLGVTVIPGAATATEVQAAYEEGLDTVKFFPAEAAGGIRALSALSQPFPMMSFVPTGGIGPANLGDYLRHPAVPAVGGSWMVARGLLSDGRWDEVTRLASLAVAAARHATSPQPPTAPPVEPPTAPPPSPRPASHPTSAADHPPTDGSTT